MARVNVDAWLQEEVSSKTVQRVISQSAVEGPGTVKEPMGTVYKLIDRPGTIGVAVTAKGSAYNEEQPTGDQVTLTARKFTAALRIAEEDIADLPASGVTGYIDDRKADWGSSYARFIDNAALGTNAAVNGTTVPFTSVYKAVTTADAGVSYTANANHVNQAGASTTRAMLSSTLAKLEQGSYWSEPDLVVMAHPKFRATLRDMVDSQGRPLFDANDKTLFGFPIIFTVGAMVTATASTAPTGAGGAKGTAGNPLLIVANKNVLVLGVRSGPESVNISGWDGTSALTDEAIIKMRSRRAFAVTDVNGVAVLEASTA